MAKVNLDDIKRKSHPYQVPDGYFEDLNASILERTSSGSQTLGAWYKQPVWQMVVASFCLLIIAGVFFTNGGQPEEDLLAGVSDEEIMIYLANNEITESEILEHFNITEEDLLQEEEFLLEDIEIDDSLMDDLYLEYDIQDQAIQI